VRNDISTGLRMPYRHLYSRRDGPAWQQPANSMVRKRLSIPEKALPVAQLLFAAMGAQGLSYDTVAEASGILRATIKSWRRRAAPTFVSIEAVFNAIGWSFLPCPKIEVLPADIAADLASLAAKMKVELPGVWSALANLAADQALLRERAEERIAAREAEREALRVSRRLYRRRKPSNDNMPRRRHRSVA
jgi:hypothetical protein